MTLSRPIKANRESAEGKTLKKRGGGRRDEKGSMKARDEEWVGVQSGVKGKKDLTAKSIRGIRPHQRDAEICRDTMRNGIQSMEVRRTQDTCTDIWRDTHTTYTVTFASTHV